MTALTRHEPLHGWAMGPSRGAFRDRFRRLVRAANAMRIDVSESDDAYTVKAEIAGARKEDISVRVDGHVVSIEARIREEKVTRGSDERVLTRELHRGGMSRTFTLAHEIDGQAAGAKFEDGILSLTLPKREGAKGRKLAIA